MDSEFQKIAISWVVTDREPIAHQYYGHAQSVFRFEGVGPNEGRNQAAHSHCWLLFGP